jgi:hypothetical protein
MAHELEMIKDGLVRLAFIGDIGEADVDAFIQDLQPYLNAVTEGNFLDLLVDSSRGGKMSSVARRKFTELNKSSRFGRIGICNINAFNRVFTTFLMKATGRQNMGFFDSEEEALAWLDKGGK